MKLEDVYVGMRVRVVEYSPQCSYRNLEDAKVGDVLTFTELPEHYSDFYPGQPCLAAGKEWGTACGIKWELVRSKITVVINKKQSP